MKFLMGMNESFGQVRTQVLLMDPWPSLNKVYSLLIQEEMKRNVGNKTHPRVESTALAAKGQNFTVNSNFGHGSKGKEKPECTHCGKQGHTANKGPDPMAH